MDSSHYLGFHPCLRRCACERVVYMLKGQSLRYSLGRIDSEHVGEIDRLRERNIMPQK